MKVKLGLYLLLTIVVLMVFSLFVWDFNKDHVEVEAIVVSCQLDPIFSVVAIADGQEYRFQCSDVEKFKNIRVGKTIRFNGLRIQKPGLNAIFTSDGYVFIQPIKPNPVR